jgi:hypothetical protein
LDYSQNFKKVEKISRHVIWPQKLDHFWPFYKRKGLPFSITPSIYWSQRAELNRRPTGYELASILNIPEKVGLEGEYNRTKLGIKWVQQGIPWQDESVPAYCGESKHHHPLKPSQIHFSW